jgi:hypothetical protein
MTELEKHLSGLLHNSSNSSDSIILICDNAKGRSISDSEKSCRKPPTSDSPRHHRRTKKRRLPTHSDLVETAHFLEAESRWESNEEQLFELSPSCPLRSPDSHRKATTPASRLLMALPDECLLLSPGRRNELAKHRLIESMNLLRLDDSCTDVFGEPATDLDA